MKVIWCRSAGFAYLEVLVAVAVLAVLLVPAMDGLHTGLQSSEAQAGRAAGNQRMQAKMEEVLAQSFSTLASAAEAAGSASIPSSFSDPITDPERRVVFLSYYDGDSQAYVTTPTDLIWVRLQMLGSNDELRTLVAK